MMVDQQQRPALTIRTTIVRIIIAIIVVPLLYGAISVYFLYVTQARQQEIARDVIVAGGKVALRRVIPIWIPRVVGAWLPLWDRLWIVNLSGGASQVTDNDVKQLHELTDLKQINLNNTNITDRGLQHLKGLKNLEAIHLSNTQITDAGLDFLKDLPNLRYLDDSGTKTTEEGRSKLRRSLPRLTIWSGAE